MQTANPETLTVEQIERTLREDMLFVTLNGVEYMAGWDGDANGIYAWTLPADEGAESVMHFGWDEEEAAPAVHEWIRKLSAYGALDAAAAPPEDDTNG